MLLSGELSVEESVYSSLNRRRNEQIQIGRNMRSLKADVKSGSVRAFKEMYGPVKNKNYNNKHDNLLINIPCSTLITIWNVNAILLTVH